MGNKKIKKQKAKKSAIRFLFFGVTCIVITITIILSISKIWTQIYSKYKEKKELEQKLVKMKEKEQELSIDVEKMQDPEYVGRYLREKYFYSKNDEYIIRIPKK